MEQPILFVIDDDAAVRSAIRRLLLSLRLPVRSFGSAEEFLAKTASDARGCLILDLRLPGMSGLQLQQQLTDGDWNLATIFVTAHDEDEAEEAAMRLGAVAFLRKPFDRRQFLASVHAAMATIKH